MQCYYAKAGKNVTGILISSCLKSTSKLVLIQKAFLHFTLQCITLRKCQARNGK